MARKDIPDWMVCAAYIEARKRREIKDNLTWPYDVLIEWTAQPEKVCYAAMERADDNGYIDYGVSLRAGWVTEEGAQLLEQESPEELLLKLKDGIKQLSYNIYN